MSVRKPTPSTCFVVTATLHASLVRCGAEAGGGGGGGAEGQTRRDRWGGLDGEG